MLSDARNPLHSLVAKCFWRTGGLQLVFCHWPSCFFFRNSLIKACFDRDLHRVLAPLNFLCREAADENDKSWGGVGFTPLSFHKVLLNLGHLKTSVSLVLVIDCHQCSGRRDIAYCLAMLVNDWFEDEYIFNMSYLLLLLRDAMSKITYRVFFLSIINV